MSRTADRLLALTPREASIFACLVDSIVEPEPPLPPVSRSRAPFIFDAWLAQAPLLNRISMRVLLYVAELAPLAVGERRRMRRLPRDRRVAMIEGLANGGPYGRGLLEVARIFCVIGYYGDDDVSLQIGFDADAVAERGRQLRADQDRP